MAGFVSLAVFARVTPGDLRCEYQTNPLGLDTTQPRLSWILESSERNQTQSAFQILAASTPEKLSESKAYLWNSGKIVSGESIGIVYGGKPLRSGQKIFWSVRVWEGAGEASAFSKPASFEMALLNPADWKAKWITRPSAFIDDAKMFDDHPAPLFRKEFSVAKKIQRARVYVTGLGYYELHLNGARVGDHELDPGWTTYSKRVLYSTYDVTEQLKRGKNAFGLMLGNGWYNPLPLKMWGKINPRDALTIGEPRAILQLVVEFSDGTSQTVVTDETWKYSDGPIIRNSVYLGEVYDARKEQRGWDRPDFKDATWAKAIIATDPIGELHAQTAPPIRITKTLTAQKITESKPGVYIVDFGQNFAGWVRLHVKGAAGTKVRMRYGELLFPDGSLNGMTAVCGQRKAGGPNYIYDGKGEPKTAFQLDEFILRGDGEEIYTPRFTFHGFRYVEVTGFPGKPDLKALEGLRLNSDVAHAGSFTCSNDAFNRIQEMVEWTLLSNIFSVESDCPHREKFGYGGDIVAAGEMAMFNFDMNRFYEKAVWDLADAARRNGGFTETAPFVGIADIGLGEGAGPVEWGTAHPFLLWKLYQFYGDKRLLEQNYEAAKRWLALLKVRSKLEILPAGISDHESLVPKPQELDGTAFYFFNAKLFSQIARALGKNSDADDTEALADEIRIGFNTEFLLQASGRYEFGSQACQAYALYFDLALDEEKQYALNLLVNDIGSHDGHLTTGIFGTKFMLNALSDLGRADLVYEMVNVDTFPSWRWMLKNGATTLWEHWEFSDNTYSHNHPMFGSVSEWFYKHLAGIQPAAGAVGFDRIVIHPKPVSDLKWVKASYNSVRGKIVSEWKKDAESFKLNVTIPVNTTATIFLPTRNVETITERGKPLASLVGAKLLPDADDSVAFTVGSGSYSFTVK